MLLIIGGHPRSGTTLLYHLCDNHPDIAVTLEFKNFQFVGQPYLEYSRNMIKYGMKKEEAFDSSYQWNKYKKLRNLVFATRYLLILRRYCRKRISFEAIEMALKRMYPQSIIMGDKYPDYIFMTEKFLKADRLYRVVIYRDCRDVTSSFLRQVRTEWKDLPWINGVNTAKGIAEKWVRAIEVMGLHADKLHIIRYENLVQQPKQTMERLGEYLGIDPSGFRVRMPKAGSISKYKQGLTEEELADVMEIAGPTMARLGYA
ncbi:MAG: sulfotransferase [Deltaproteobacteria bacterium]|nr:sulfotransferase [Deltaproteobacteria bacterium]